MPRSAIATVVLAIAGCAKQPSTEPSIDAATAPLTPEQTLVEIFRRYPEGIVGEQFKDPVPAPDDPRVGKLVRVAGVVRTVEASLRPVVELAAPTGNSTLRCALPNGATPLAMGSAATLEGTLVIQLSPLPGPGGPLPSPGSRVRFLLESCRAIQSTTRTFGSSAAALGLTVVPFETLLGSPPKPGTRVAFSAAAIRKNGGYVVEAGTTTMACGGEEMKHRELHPFEARVTIAARIAAAPKGELLPFALENCQAIDP